MDRDNYADMFKFRLGQCVRWAEYPHRRHWIAQRRWTQRMLLDPLVHYRLSLSEKADTYIDWIREEDLLPWDEPT